jgi:hypothetical protein
VVIDPTDECVAGPSEVFGVAAPTEADDDVEVALGEPQAAKQTQTATIANAHRWRQHCLVVIMAIS